MAQVSYYQFKEKAKSKTWQNVITCIISNLSLLNRNSAISFVIKKTLNMSKGNCTWIFKKNKQKIHL